MFRQLFFSIGLMAVSFGAFSQTNCKCCTEKHQQFDFWIGDWVVHDTTGTKVGDNTITQLEDKCIISEHWRGAKGTTGRSYSYFNRTDSTWNQVWIDNTGSNLVLKGKAQPNQMILKSELLPGKKVDFYYNQVTWTANEDGTVSQLWEIYDQKGKLLTTAFLGIYSKK